MQLAMQLPKPYNTIPIDLLEMKAANLSCIGLGVTSMFIDLTETELEEMVNGFCTFPVAPDCKLGDDVVFLVNKAPAARAVISRIEKFEGYRVFWQANTFEELPTEIA
jgi:hypothetical protein